MGTMPRKGDFIVLSIDPKASLEDLEGEDWATVCKGMTNKKYIAYVDRSWPYLYNPFIKYHTHDLYFIFQGLPTGNLAYCQEPGMSIPILPNTSHPASRPPLSPPLPLPWEDCYISVFASCQGRVAVDLVQTGSPHPLSAEDRVRLERLMSSDRKRREEIYQIDHPGERPPPLHKPLQTLQPGDELIISAEPGEVDDEPDPISADLNCGPGNANTGPMSDAEALTALLIFGGVVTSETSPVITCSYDLSAVDVINDYSDFFKEVEVLNRIRADYRARQLEKIKDARRLDDEHFGNTEKQEPRSEVQPSADANETPKRSSHNELRRILNQLKHVLVPTKLITRVSTFHRRGSSRLRQIISRVRGQSMPP